MRAVKYQLSTPEFDGRPKGLTAIPVSLQTISSSEKTVTANQTPTLHVSITLIYENDNHLSPKVTHEGGNRRSDPAQPCASHSRTLTVFTNLACSQDYAVSLERTKIRETSQTQNCLGEDYRPRTTLYH